MASWILKAALGAGAVILIQALALSKKEVRMRTGRMLMSGLCAIVVGGAVAQEARAQAFSVDLTVEELAGVARKGEPVRMGVPLPKGVAKDTAELALTTAQGRPVPAQFSEAMRWREDGSLKWVQAVFKADVRANGKTGVKLVKRPAPPVRSRLQVQRKGDAIEIENGLIKIAIKGGGFNLFDSVQAGTASLIAPHEGGFVATLNGKTFRPSPDSQAEIHESGPESVVVRVAGRLTDGTSAPFSYICYIHVFNESPVVQASFSYVHAEGKGAGDFVVMEDLSLVLPTVLQRAAAKVGGENRTHGGRNVSVVTRHSDAIEIVADGKTVGTAKGKSTKPLTLGWGGLSSGTRGVYAGVRWFWQMFPKAIEIKDDGTIRMGLYAREGGEPLDVYMGQGRTHYLTFLFAAPRQDAELTSVFAGAQMPLRAVAAPRYYCRDSEAFGPLADSDPALYPADLRKTLQQYDKALKDSALAIEKKIDGHTYQGVTLDSYGYYAWGDVFHWANTQGVKDKWNILWESNYYDYPFAALLQFARTGDMLYLDIADRHGLHLADVFMVKWHPQKHLIGACRYSPPANHVGNDVDYRKPQPYLSVEFNHHKAQSILYRYLLLGDLQAKDDFLLALNCATLNREGSWRQCRGAGAKLWTLTEGYDLTGGEAVMAMMKSTVNAGLRHARQAGGKGFGHSKGQFMYGLATEGLLRYYWQTGHEDAVEIMKVMNDWLIERNLDGAVANSAMSMAFLWRQTGDDKYRQAALRLMAQKSVNRPKAFGQEMRSTGYAWRYLSNLEQTKR